MKTKLTIGKLKKETAVFSKSESVWDEPALYSVTDGKKVGTYLEHKLMDYLSEKYEFARGCSASGIDFPNLNVDIKVTSVRQPQSSCPFKSAEEKVYGLNCHLLVFVYQKTDDPIKNTARLDIKHAIFVDKKRTADYQTTKGIIDILNNDGNKDDILAFITERNLPLEDIGANNLAEKILKIPPKQGFLTISSALQWRLHFTRIIQEAEQVTGISRIR